MNVRSVAVGRSCCIFQHYVVLVAVSVLLVTATTDCTDKLRLSTGHQDEPCQNVHFSSTFETVEDLAIVQ